MNLLQPLMTYSTTHKASELTLLEKVSSLLFGEVEAEAFWGWDASLNINWCRGWWNSWHPCGIRLYMNKIMYNVLFAVGSGQAAMYGMYKSGSALYFFMARFTVMCGSLIAHCNAIIFGLSMSIAYFAAARSASFESICRQNLNRTGISFEASFNGGVKYLWCSNK